MGLEVFRVSEHEEIVFELASVCACVGMYVCAPR
jgi:hypothetical protein